MAREIVCDRCGERLPESDSDEFVRITKSDDRDNRFSLEYSKDLCSTCFQKFLKWMEGDK